MNELCPEYHQRGTFGYRDKETGEMVWYCPSHRLGQYWADARRDNLKTNKDAAPFRYDRPAPSRAPFTHYCHCGEWGYFGYGVRLSEIKEGTWFCAERRPDSKRGDRRSGRASAMTHITGTVTPHRRCHDLSVNRGGEKISPRTGFAGACRNSCVTHISAVRVASDLWIWRCGCLAVEAHPPAPTRGPAGTSGPR
jgi:hypothetical protein